MTVTSVLYAACTEACTITIYDRAADGRISARPEPLAVPGGPMWLTTDPEQRYLYCPTITANAIVSFAIGADGGLTELGQPVPYPAVGDEDPSGAPWTGDPCPCHVSTDKTGRFLFTSFYTAGMITVHAIASDGSVEPAVLQTIQTTHGCHSIQTDASNKFVYVPCVAALATQAGGDPNNLLNGGNRIFQFAFDPANGSLTPTPSLPLIPVRPLSLSLSLSVLAARICTDCNIRTSTQEPTGPAQSPRFGTAWEPDAPTSRFGTRPEVTDKRMHAHPSRLAFLH
jgi:hypothetical protein